MHVLWAPLDFMNTIGLGARGCQHCRFRAKKTITILAGAVIV